MIQPLSEVFYAMTINLWFERDGMAHIGAVNRDKTYVSQNGVDARRLCTRAKHNFPTFSTPQHKGYIALVENC